MELASGRSIGGLTGRLSLKTQSPSSGIDFLRGVPLHQSPITNFRSGPENTQVYRATGILLQNTFLD